MVEDLGVTLRAADDVGSACRAVVEALAARGLLPSVYLERGGRLRCQAVHGYWQIRDGMLPNTGVIGTTFATGQESFLRDVRRDGTYLEAGDGVAAELCVPLRVEGLLAGVVNVEADRPIGDEEAQEVRAAARALAARIEALGGPPPESPAQQLARHAVRLAAMTDVADIEREVLAAALDAVPLTSGALLCVHPDDRIEPRAARGPLAGVLLEAPQEALRAIVGFVRTGSSSYTVAAPGDGMATGMASLRGAGAESLAAFGAPVEDTLVVLILADERPKIRLDGEQVELLELLTAQASSSLRTAIALHELQVQAATDPLTGLGHHASFHDALRASGDDAGQVAVLLCDVDAFKRFNDTQGHQAGDHLLRRLATTLSRGVRRGDRVFRIGGDEFAALLHVDGDAEALEAGRRLRDAVAESGSPVTVSIGVAVRRPGESDPSVLARADRALYVVKADGRDGVVLDRDTGGGQQALPV
ncbi:MAG: sensor domain-containing diguanylate cyclase [Solirubrobacterales bacterium]|nr:sensor domain-containing diguanylate cyclase [Solirubrobacterales bacterium]